MKTEGTLIYHKITVATGLLQNNAYDNELVLFCLIIPCAHCLFVFYFYKKCKWLFWFCVHRSLRSKRFGKAFRTFDALFSFLAAGNWGAQKSMWRGRGKERRKRLPANPTILKNPFVHERSFLIGAAR